MEIVAMDMKLRGMYIARQLSFTGVTFKIEEVLLSQSYVKMYNKAVKLVRFIPSIFNAPANVSVSFVQCNVGEPMRVYFSQKTHKSSGSYFPNIPSLLFPNLLKIAI